MDFINKKLLIKINRQAQQMTTHRFSSDLGFDSLIAENSMLKDRVSKINEIEPYIEILLVNNKKYQKEVSDFQIQNHQLRCKIDDILEENMAIKETHKSEVTQLRRGFQSDISKLILELKDILRDKEAMQSANNSLIEQLGLRHKRDLQGKKRQYQELELQTAKKLNKLTEGLKCKQNQLEEKLWEFRDKETAWALKVDHLNFERNSLIKEKSQIVKELDIVSEEKQMLGKKYKQLTKQNEEISHKWLQSEKQKSQTIMVLKSRNSEYQKDNDKLLTEVRSQEKMINQLNRRISHLTNECEEICKKNHELETTMRRNMRSAEDLKAEHREIVEKLDTVSKVTNSEIKKQSQNIDRLQEQNKNLNRQNIELHSDNQSKTAEIEDLLRAIEKLQRKIGDVNEKSISVEEQNSRYYENLKSLQAKVADLSLEKKSLSQKIQLYVSHNTTLEELLQKEQKKTANLESSRFQLETIAKGALSKPEQICREYERQIQKIMKDFLIEKQKIEESHEIEIQDIRASYETALKQKQDYFNHKIIFLEKQMSSLRSFR